jgi:hypothetical protein
MSKMTRTLLKDAAVQTAEEKIYQLALKRDFGLALMTPEEKAEYMNKLSACIDADPNFAKATMARLRSRE